MKLSMQQTARPELQLRLSPQMLQRIEVLQLPALDLTEMIEQELQENEALELVQDGPPETTGEAPEPGEDSGDDWDDAEWERREPGSGPTRMEVMAATAVAPVTLAEHLGRQLDLLDLNPRERVLGRAILAALTDRGWLAVPLADVPVELEPRPTAEELEHVLH
ncbi:MAG TPA: hypothetical protein VFF36_14985, partial [Planctomycetota bacterium]|nr:hypothetical protein [Planctomycetota bacterium]